jgi:hypothetical protein
MDSCSNFSSPADLLMLLELRVLTFDILEIVLLLVTVGTPEVLLAAAVVRSAARSSASMLSKSLWSASCRLSMPFLLFFGILRRWKMTSKRMQHTHT